MRIFIATLLLSAVAVPLRGEFGPVVTPSRVTIRVGEEIRLHGYQNAGGLSPGFPYHWRFFSDARDVAEVRGFASGESALEPDPAPSGRIYVTGRRPGIAHVRIRDYSGHLATITVLPRIEPVQIHAETTRVFPGQEVVLLATVSGYEEPSIFTWYRGRIGDTAHPLQASNDPQWTFIATSPGTSHFWVQAFSGSVSSSAEIAIETAAPPRRRSARH